MPPKFVPRERKHKKLARKADSSKRQNTAPTDTNVDEVAPTTKDEREERRQRLRAEFESQRPLSKASSKKRKRLEKYVDTKLRKEENLELIKKLEKQTVDTSLLRSSKKLGRGEDSKREALSRALKERRAGLNHAENEEILFEQGTNGTVSSSEDDNEVPEVQKASNPTTKTLSTEPVRSAPSFGGGLKRPLELDESGNPLIKTRKRVKTTAFPKSWQVMPPSPPPEVSDWSGISSNSDGGHESESELDASEQSDDETGSDDLSGSESSEVEDDGENSVDGDVNPAEVKAALSERKSAFSAWASQQRNEAIGFQPTNNVNNATIASSETALPLNSTSETLKQPGTMNTSTIQQPYLTKQMLPSKSTTHTVHVHRPAYIETLRRDLPIVASEQQIMEAITNNPIVMITAATGSGKTTQVPQFLYEAGYGSPQTPFPGMIGVTQPRRVAAVSVARRVSEELGGRDRDNEDAQLGTRTSAPPLQQMEKHVAHQVRFESDVSKATRIKFMTDGVLLREASTDFTLSSYSAIILDEAHERTLNTDILLGLLPRVVSTRLNLSEKYPDRYKPLKLIIMSASLKSSNFSDNKDLFNTGLPPIVGVEGRQFPVQIHWTKRTERDYVEEAYKKIVRGHRKLPRGGMLVFLTGQAEISHLMRRLKEELKCTSECRKGIDAGNRVPSADGNVEEEDLELDLTGSKGNIMDMDSDSDFGCDSETSIRGVDNDKMEDDAASDASFDIPNNAEPNTNMKTKHEGLIEPLKAHILPLYSQMSPSQQQLVFEPPPPNSRAIILATNVAETSLTIPDIRYIIDTGRAKQKAYSPQSGIQSFSVDFISKASADQRAGRAGRTGPGHVYRLYSSAVYEQQFPSFTEPEILRSPVEGVVLTLKSMGVPQVAQFPFPTPPSKVSLQQAERLLEYLGAVSIGDGKVTQVGKDIARYPLSPRLARILVTAAQQGCVEHAITMVAALAVPDLFVQENQLDLRDSESVDPSDANQQATWTEADNKAAASRENRRKAHSAFHGHVSRLDRSSDAVKLLTTLCDFTMQDPRANFGEFARLKALKEASQLREQLAAIVKSHVPQAANSVSTKGPLTIPNPAQVQLLRKVVAAGYIDQIAIRADLSPTPPVEAANLKAKRVADVPYITLFPAALKEGNFQSQMSHGSAVEAERTKFVYIHPASLLTHTASPSKLPQYLVFSHMSRTSAPTASAHKVPKTRIHPLVPIAAPQIVALATGTPLLEEGKPIGKVEAMNRGDDGLERRMCWTTPFLVGESGSMGWPLPPARKVVQRREKTRGWVVDKIVG